MMGRPREKATQRASYHRTKSENDQQDKAPFFICSALSSLVQSVAMIIMTKFPNDVTSRFYSFV